MTDVVDEINGDNSKLNVKMTIKVRWIVLMGIDLFFRKPAAETEHYSFTI